MAEDDVAVAGVSPPSTESPLPIPESGLVEIFADWSGAGELWDALAAVDDPSAARKWRRSDVIARAHRVLLQRLEPTLRKWPRTTEAWLERLPAQSVVRQFEADYIPSGVSWHRTTRQFGWPPRRFVGRQRDRSADSLLVTTTKWAIEQLADIWTSARRLLPTAGSSVAPQLEAAVALLDFEAFARAESILPSTVDIRSITAEGVPWTFIAEVCDELRLVNVSLLELSRRGLFPQPELRGRLFHLAVLGLLLHALRSSGYQLISRRPIGAEARGPAYVFRVDGGAWAHVWFEASAAWSFYGRSSPYAEAARGVPGAGDPLGADIMVVIPDTKVFIVECKYSRNPQTVARGGYEQTVAYVTEASTKFAPLVRGVVIGPEGVVTARHETTLSTGSVAIAPPHALAALLTDFLSA